MFRRGLCIVAVASLALVAAACGDDDDDDSSATTAGGADTTAAAGTTAAPATGTPIVLGAVGSQSGVDIFPEPMEAAAAVFDKVNAEGGINGHPIEYHVEDDGDTPEQAATAAKRLVEDIGVLAMVGGGSIVDCSTNGKYYVEQGIYSLAGANACVEDSFNVASTNTGPFLGTFMMLDYMYDDLGLTDVCFSGLNVGLTPAFQNVFIPIWEEVTGYKLGEFIVSEPGEDLTAAVTRAADCPGVLLAYTEPNYIAYAQIAEAQGLTDGSIVYAMLTSGYSVPMLEKIGSAAEGWYSNSEFAPYTDDSDTSPDMKAYLDLMAENGITPTSFGQSGYLAAMAMVQALETIEGEYTRESVNAALEQVVYETTLLGEPWKWVPLVGGKQANVASKIVQIKDGKFVTVSDWLFWPPR